MFPPAGSFAGTFLCLKIILGGDNLPKYGQTMERPVDFA